MPKFELNLSYCIDLCCYFHAELDQLQQNRITAITITLPNFSVTITITLHWKSQITIRSALSLEILVKAIDGAIADAKKEKSQEMKLFDAGVEYKTVQLKV